MSDTTRDIDNGSNAPIVPRRPYWVWRDRALYALAALCVLGILTFLFTWRGSETLRISAGSASGERHRIAEQLGVVAAENRVHLKIVPTSGSGEAIELVATGELDAALIQGGEEAGPDVRLAASLYVEPLHILVRPELAGQRLSDLRGQRLNLSRPKSGTRRLSTQALEFSGLRSADDYQTTEFSYSQLMSMPTEELPDALFMVQSMPSDLVQDLVHRHGYGFMAAPYGDSLPYRDMTIGDATIPALMYGADVETPPEPVRTIGNRLLLVVHRDAPNRVVRRLVESVYDSQFARLANLPQLTSGQMSLPPEYPLHPGAREYLRRNEPLLSAEVIDNVESMRSFVVSLLVGLWLLWRWNQSRRSRSFDVYIDKITQIEKRILKWEQAGDFSDIGPLQTWRKELITIKAEALEEFTYGRLKGDTLMTNFLHHVTDVREYLNSLIFYQRKQLDRRERDHRLGLGS